jgi:hypothetical protein
VRAADGNLPHVEFSAFIHNGKTIEGLVISAVHGPHHFLVILAGGTEIVDLDGELGFGLWLRRGEFRSIRDRMATLCYHR